MPVKRPWGAIDTGSATRQVKHLNFRPRSRNPNRGQTRARHEAPLRQLRRQILRSQQGPDRLPEVRHGLRDRRAGVARRAATAAAAAARRSGRCRAPARRPRSRCRRPPTSRSFRSRRPTPRPQGKKAGGEAAEGDDDIEVEETERRRFIEEQEEGDDDVTDIIGEGREDEEET